MRNTVVAAYLLFNLLLMYCGICETAGVDELLMNCGTCQHVKHCRWQTPSTGLRLLPSTTAVFSYVIGSRKLSANEKFFVGTQTVVSLLQTTQIKHGVSFIAANKVYTITNKTTIVWIETKLFFFFFFFFTRGGCASCLRAYLAARLLLQSY